MCSLSVRVNEILHYLLVYGLMKIIWIFIISFMVLIMYFSD